MIANTKRAKQLEVNGALSHAFSLICYLDIGPRPSRELFQPSNTPILKANISDDLLDIIIIG